jgi:type IV secretion system protein VirB10
VISEKTILDPEASKPGVPTKKSTIAVLVLGVLVLGLVSSLLFTGGSNAPTQTAVAKDSGELKQVGSGQTIKDEEAAAARAATAAASSPVADRASQGGTIASAAGGANSPRTSPVPADVRRDNNVGALYDQKHTAGIPSTPGSATGAAAAGSQQYGSGRNADVEQDAATRISKSLVMDVDEPKSASGNSNAPIKNVALDAINALTQTPQVPSQAVNADIERLKAQAAAAAPTVQSAGTWLKEYAKDSAGGSKVITGKQGPTKLVLRQGKVIPAVLGREINSDLPGRITAYVSSDVYDPAGQLLVPMGSMLVGQYNSDIHVGQTRVMFGFERLILPNGFSFDLPAAPGSDLAGAAGMAGDVDNHFFKMFGSSLLVALLADHTKQPSSVTNINSGGASTAAGQVLTDVSRSILERNRVIAPTITVEQGTRINVEVVADMVFPEPYRRNLLGLR